MALPLLLILGPGLRSSPFSDFKRASRTCSNQELVQLTERWLILDPGYADAIVWMRKCGQYPESALPTIRKLKEDMFRLEKPPDVPGYLKEMSESRMKMRIARAWTTYLYLRSDKRSYSVKERRYLATIPSRLESIALARVDIPDRSLCSVELYENLIVQISIEESFFWRKFHEFKGRSDLPAADRHTLRNIETCLARLYADPSIGRDAHIAIGSGTIFFAALPDSAEDSRSLADYQTECQRLAVHSPNVTLRSAFQHPAPVREDIIRTVKEMRTGCRHQQIRRLFRTDDEAWEDFRRRNGYPKL